MNFAPKNIHQAILSTLAYFDVFDYPMKSQEIHKFLGIPVNINEVEEALQRHENSWPNSNGYFALSDINTKLEKRLADEKRSTALFGMALKNGKIIQKMPFTRCVCISGSMSKYVLQEDGDIDYFIIAKSHSIWLCKAFLKLYKKFFLKNSREYFCINYIVSDEKMCIQEQNIFTSTEIATLIPLSNEKLFNTFLDQNQWITQYLPQAKNSNNRTYLDKQISKYPWANSLEWMLDNKLGHQLDQYLNAIVKRRNKKKYNKYLSSKHFELMFRSNKDQVKVHNSNHQTHILESHKAKVERLQLAENGK